MNVLNSHEAVRKIKNHLKKFLLPEVWDGKGGRNEGIGGTGMEGENLQTKFIQWTQVVRDVPLPAGKPKLIVV